MKIIISFCSILFSTNVIAAGGFTWLGPLSHAWHIPEHILTFVLVGLILVVVGLVYRSKVNAVNNIVIPDKGFTFRNLVEGIGQFLYDQCKGVMGDQQAKKYFPFICCIFIVILLSNLIGLIPGFLPPTEHLSTAFALGVFSFIYYNLKGCKELGTINYLKHFAGPLWYMAILIFPIEILSNFVRPISLALRLRGNMYGDHLVLSIFSDLAPIIIPIVFMLLGILVSVIQAFVFSVLSMVYISLATAHHDHEEDAHH